VPPGAASSYDGGVCIDDSPASLAAAVRHDVEPAIEIDLEPVDSMLVTVAKAGREHQFLFDAGTSPDGVTENMRRLDIDPSCAATATSITPPVSTG
jgi:hypothetical protein